MATAECKVTLEDSKFGDGQFLRIKQGNMWICLSNKALKELNTVKKAINEDVLFLKPGEYELTQQKKISIGLDNHTPTISFIKISCMPMTLTISDTKWSKVISAIPTKRGGEEANIGQKTTDIHTQRHPSVCTDVWMSA